MQVFRRSFLTNSALLTAGSYLFLTISKNSLLGFLPNNDNILVRALKFKPNTSLNDRLSSLNSLIEVSKMKQIVSKYKLDGLLVYTNCYPINEFVVFEYYFNSSSSKYKFQEEIKSVKVFNYIKASNNA